MQFTLHGFVIALYAATAIAIFSAYLSSRRKNVHGARSLTALSLGVALWTFSYSLQIQSPELAWNKFWSNMQFIAVAMVPYTWFVFALQYSQQEKAPPFRQLAWLLILPIFSSLMFWTNDLHHLAWESVRVVPAYGIYPQENVFGVYFWAHTAICYLFIMSGTIIFLYQAIKSHAAYRTQTTATILAIIIVLLANGVTVFKLLPLPNLDITPFAFTLSAGILTWAQLQLGLLDLIPVGSDVILNQMGDGVLVIDDKQRINFINPAFEKLAGLTPATSIGHSVKDVLYNWPDIFRPYEQSILTEINVSLGASKKNLEMHITPIQQSIGSKSYIYVFRNVANRASLASSINREQAGNENGRPMPIFLAVSAPDGKILDINYEFTFHTGFNRDEACGRTLLELGIWDIKTRAEITRQIREKGQLVDETITIKEKGNQPRTWKLSIVASSLDGQSVHIWQALPNK